MEPLLYITCCITLGLLCAVIPAARRAWAVRRVDLLMRQFCVSPREETAREVEAAMAKYEVTHADIDADLYGRWMGMRLAMCRLRGFRSNQG